MIIRPTEDKAFYNLERIERLKTKYNGVLYFTNIEYKIFQLDVFVKTEIMKRKPHSRYLYNMCKYSGYSENYILRILKVIDEKIEVRIEMKLPPIPTIEEKKHAEKQNRRLNYKYKRNKKID